MRTVAIPWGDEARTVTGRLLVPADARPPAILLAHGAGTDQDHASLVGLRDGLAGGGHPVLTFNYPYTERGGRRPDRTPVLLACHRAAAAWLRQTAGPDIVLAGRSMGGRMATYLAAEDDPAVGLVLYAYPLHPPGRPDRLRQDHLPSIRAPMLFQVGGRDPFARPELVDRWIRSLPNATVEVVADADHSFRVPKRTGRSAAEVLEGLIASTLAWLAATSSVR